MAELVTPTTRVRESHRAAMAEFAAEGRGGPDDDSVIGSELARHGSAWHTPDGFAAYVEQLAADASESTPRPAHLVPATTLWLVDGDEFIGRLAIRHRLTPRLEITGGHIGYDVRPSARRRGHATAMLTAALPIAAALGIGHALLTCDEGNAASRVIIERVGGQPAPRLGAPLRFWIATGA